MTADEFGTVDIDLLADFIGDALTGAERDRVARLVADDPEWRSAYALLAPGMDEAGATLGALAAAEEPMPDDLWVRLESALTSAKSPTAGSTSAQSSSLDYETLDSGTVGSPVAEPSMISPGLAAPTEPHLEPVRGATDRHLRSVPTGSERKHTSRRRRLRWAGPVAVAAGVVAFAGFGAAYLTGGLDVENGASSDAGGANAPMAAADAPERAAAGGLVSGPVEILRSGLNYSDQSLRDVAVQIRADDAVRESVPSAGLPKTQNQQPMITSSAPGDMSRFSGEPTGAALQACLEAIALQNGAEPITVQSVDYASFSGAPALIVSFTAGSVRSVWATALDCGAPGRGAQVRQTVQVP